MIIINYFMSFKKNYFVFNIHCIALHVPGEAGNYQHLPLG
jgi:hypothetical protein